MRNEEKYRTPEERNYAFAEFCKINVAIGGGMCKACKYCERGLGMPCVLLWLADEYEEIILPFEVKKQKAPHDMFGIYCKKSGVPVATNLREHDAKERCGDINAATLAWAKEMFKSGCY